HYGSNVNNCASPPLQRRKEAPSARRPLCDRTILTGPGAGGGRRDDPARALRGGGRWFDQRGGGGHRLDQRVEALQRLVHQHFPLRLPGCEGGEGKGGGRIGAHREFLASERKGKAGRRAQTESAALPQGEGEDGATGHNEIGRNRIRSIGPERFRK